MKYVQRHCSHLCLTLPSLHTASQPWNIAVTSEHVMRTHLAMGKTNINTVCSHLCLSQSSSTQICWRMNSLSPFGNHIQQLSSLLTESVWYGVLSIKYHEQDTLFNLSCRNCASTHSTFYSISKSHHIKWNATEGFTSELLPSYTPGTRWGEQHWFN